MPRPLTKRDENGKLYARPRSIEAAIAGLLGTKPQDVVRRAGVSQRGSPDFVPLECLVHLIREAWRRRDESTLSSLMTPFLARCEAILESKIPDTAMPDAPTVREEVLGELSLLIAQDGAGARPDELDFFECKFALAFRAFRLNVTRPDWTRIKRTAPLLEDERDDAGQSAKFKTEDDLTYADDLSNVEIIGAIDALGPAEREALILCRFLGYTQEEAAARCAVTDRTIRNRLTEALAKLARFKKEK